MAEVVKSITVEVTISMGHRLQSYVGVCSSPHGHNVKIEAEIQLQRDQFLDFKKVQRVLNNITVHMDHAMVLEYNDPLLDILKASGFRTYELPYEPTTENIAKEIFTYMKQSYPGTIRCTVHETDKYSATVRG